MNKGYDIISTWAESHPDVKLAPSAIGDLASAIAKQIEIAVANVTAPQFHCGHPVACLIDDGDGTQHCTWCAAEAEEQKACAERVWQVLVRNGIRQPVRTEITAIIRKERPTRERL